jgi:hypothetical protein
MIAARGSIGVAIGKVSDGCHLRQVVNFTAIAAANRAGHLSTTLDIFGSTS